MYSPKHRSNFIGLHSLTSFFQIFLLQVLIVSLLYWENLPPLLVPVTIKSSWIPPEMCLTFTHCAGLKTSVQLTTYSLLISTCHRTALLCRRMSGRTATSPSQSWINLKSVYQMSRSATMPHTFAISHQPRGTFLWSLKQGFMSLVRIIVICKYNRVTTNSYLGHTKEKTMLWTSMSNKR